MSLIKQFLKSRPEVKVTFVVTREAAGDAHQVFLVGEFNQWQPHAMRRLKSGEFKTSLNLPTDEQAQYQFCYQLIDEAGTERYDNDWEADAYVPCPYGRDNSVVQVQP